MKPDAPPQQPSRQRTFLTSNHLPSCLSCPLAASSGYLLFDVCCLHHVTHALFYCSFDLTLAWIYARLVLLVILLLIKCHLFKELFSPLLCRSSPSVTLCRIPWAYLYHISCHRTYLHGQLVCSQLLTPPISPSRMKTLIRYRPWWHHPLYPMSRTQ